MPGRSGPTRAVSPRVVNGDVVFDRRTVYPVEFTSGVVQEWTREAVTFQGTYEGIRAGVRGC